MLVVGGSVAIGPPAVAAWGYNTGPSRPCCSHVHHTWNGKPLPHLEAGARKNFNREALHSCLLRNPLVRPYAFGRKAPALSAHAQFEDASREDATPKMHRDGVALCLE